MAIENIIFDFGAVLIPLDEPQCWNNFTDLGAKAELRDQKGLFHRFEKGEITSSDFLKGMKPFFFRKKIFSTDLSNAWNSMLINPIPEENIRLLKRLRKKYRIFLLSNTNDLHIREIKRAAGPFAYNSFFRQFEKVYYSYEMGMRKPDQEIFEKVLEDNDLKPQETLYIEDGELNVKAARKLNIRTWHFNPEEDSILKISKHIEKLESE